MKLSNGKLSIKRTHINLFYLFAFAVILLVTPLVIIQSQHKTQIASHAAYPEPACTQLHGTCEDGFTGDRSQDNGAPCDGGSGKAVLDACPNQPETVRCCVPNGGSGPGPGGSGPGPGGGITDDHLCDEFGGTCMDDCSPAENCHPGKCAGNTARQCYKASTNDVPNTNNCADGSTGCNGPVTTAPGDCPAGQTRDHDGTCLSNAAPAPAQPTCSSFNCSHFGISVIGYEPCTSDQWKDGPENTPENRALVKQYCTTTSNNACRAKDGQNVAYYSPVDGAPFDGDNGDGAIPNCKVPFAKSEVLSVAADLQGIGKEAGENNNPQAKSVPATIKIFEGSGPLTAAKYTAKDNLTYDPASGKYVNSEFALGIIPQDDYQMVMQIDKYLDKQISNSSGSKLIAVGPATDDTSTIAMQVGDLAPAPNGDNFVSIIDWSAVRDCMAGNPPSACTNKQQADLNDDGVVDDKDLKIIESNMGQSGFSFETAEFKCDPDPTCNSGKDSLQLCSLLCTKKTQRS
ncbi:MAG TPA: dockerin type I domain-containing protein [Candidatus Saccharimonadales bacterium]|nr:dockerin type I domain-containing protein [Candidatus Saccharimonadales bacterium]